MNIEAEDTTFEPHEVFRIANAFFAQRVRENTFPAKTEKPALFEFYQSAISNPIDDLIDESPEERIDFYEMISIMLWSVFRVWTKGAIDEGLGVGAIDSISEETVISLFLENLDCAEGQLLLEKVKVAQRL